MAIELNKAYSFAINSQQNPSSFAVFNKLSRADFWVLVEERALAWGIKRSKVIPQVNFSSVHFSYGRVSTEPFDLDNYEGTLPNGADAWQTMLNDIATGLPAIDETDIVALLGLHGAGRAKLNNSGFSGNWGAAKDQQIVNNHYFINLLSYGYPKETFKQVPAASINAKNASSATPKNLLYRSAAPPTTKIEWFHSGGSSPAQMMLPIDMQIYLKFTPNANGGESEGAYCGVGNNKKLFNCQRLNTKTRKFLPLAKNAGLALKYAQDNNFYITSVVNAFLKMVSYTNPHTLLTPFKVENICVEGVPTCLGDVLFAGCSNPIQCEDK